MNTINMSFNDVKKAYIGYCEQTFLTSSKKYFFESGDDPRSLRLKQVSSREKVKQIKREKMVEGPKERWFSLFLLDPINFLLENQDERHTFKLLDEICDIEKCDFSSKRSFNQFLYLQIAVWNVFIQSLQKHIGREPTVHDIHSVAQIIVGEFNEFSSRQTLQQILMSMSTKTESKKVTHHEVNDKISLNVTAASPHKEKGGIKSGIKSPGGSSSLDKKKALASERFNKKVLDLCLVNQENSLPGDIATIVNDIIHRIIRDFPQKTNLFVPPTVNHVENLLSMNSGKRHFTDGSSNKASKKSKRAGLSSSSSSMSSPVAAGGLSLEDATFDDLSYIGQHHIQELPQQVASDTDTDTDTDWISLLARPPSFDAFGLLDADSVDLSTLSPIAFNDNVGNLTLDEVLAMLSPRSSTGHTGMTMTAQLPQTMMCSLH